MANHYHLHEPNNLYLMTSKTIISNIEIIKIVKVEEVAFKTELITSKTSHSFEVLNELVESKEEWYDHFMD